MRRIEGTQGERNAIVQQDSDLEEQMKPSTKLKPAEKNPSLHKSRCGWALRNSVVLILVDAAAVPFPPAS
jgi:hypothetical protein